MISEILKNMYVDPQLLADLTDTEKAVLFSAIRQEQIRRYNERDSYERDDLPTNNRKQSKKHVNYLEGPDGDLLVTIAEFEDSDRVDSPIHVVKVNASQQERFSELSHKLSTNPSPSGPKPKCITIRDNSPKIVNITSSVEVQRPNLVPDKDQLIGEPISTQKFDIPSDLVKRTEVILQPPPSTTTLTLQSPYSPLKLITVGENDVPDPNLMQSANSSSEEQLGHPITEVTSTVSNRPVVVIREIGIPVTSSPKKFIPKDSNTHKENSDVAPFKSKLPEIADEMTEEHGTKTIHPHNESIHEKNNPTSNSNGQGLKRIAISDQIKEKHLLSQTSDDGLDPNKYHSPFPRTRLPEISFDSKTGDSMFRSHNDTDINNASTKSLKRFAVSPTKTPGRLSSVLLSKFEALSTSANGTAGLKNQPRLNYLTSPVTLKTGRSNPSNIALSTLRPSFENQTTHHSPTKSGVEINQQSAAYSWFQKQELYNLRAEFDLPRSWNEYSKWAHSNVPDWFHGLLNRVQSECLLYDVGVSGSYLVHLNESFPGYVISLFSDGNCHHFLVSVITVFDEQDEKLKDSHNSIYQLFGVTNPQQFRSLRDLVQYYSIHSISQPGKHLLLYPIKQRNPLCPDYLDIFYPNCRSIAISHC